MVTHTFEPIYSQSSRILILGTIPSPKSRENGFYYGHPRNNFWRAIAAVFDLPVPENTNEKISLLLENKIALWDVLKSCEISGAEDSSIKSPVVNDFSEILERTNINAVFTTGKKATSIYMKYCHAETNIPAVYLPSPSPANTMKLEKLIEAYRIILEYLYTISF